MKAIIKLLTPAVCSILLISCGNSGTNDQDNTGTHESGLLNEFIIMAYSGPPLEEVTLERYQEIAESGIEYLVPGNGTFNGEQNLKAMELGLKTGIKIIPTDMRILPFTLAKSVVIDTVAIREVVNDYKDHPAFAAYVIRDEPSGDLFPGLRDISNVFRAEDPVHEPLINLLPSYGSPTQLGFDNYRSHIKSFIETVKPGLLSYDYYALRNGVTWYDGWFNDLTIVREETQKVQIPFIVFVQSEGIKEGLRVPNRAEILWQVNTALAYGARGFGWFCYWTPTPDQGFQQGEGAPPPLVESHFNAMIDLNGNRTDVYDFVREANLYLKKVGRGLLEWDNAEVARYEVGKMLSGGSSPIVTPEGDDANIVIGTYRKDNRARLVVSNASCDEPISFALNLDPGYEPVEVFASIDADPSGQNESLLEWAIKPGGSVVIEVKKTQ